MLGEYRVAEEGTRLPHVLSGDALMAVVRRLPWAICAITAAAAALRFARLGAVSPNPFYDAAVRSMSLSWHNFFFGAFDPAARLSIDKPPLDLWAQVLSVKLFGWGSFALKLPEALAGTLAVPLLYDTVRRVVGAPAGLAAAVALAVLPESVLTARSDTMDAMMMLLVLAALWLTIRAAASRRRGTLLLAGAALGLAFNVKLLEALIALPALAAFYLLVCRLPLWRRLANVLLGGAAMAAVALSWAVAVTLAPGRHPWAVGSTDGSVWNAMFVFNGFGRVSGAPSTKPGGPGLFRLLVSTGWHYDVLFGCAMLAALVLGVAAALPRRGARHEKRIWRRDALRQPGAAFAVLLVLWIGIAIAAFDTMHVVHARYLDAVAPALAAAIGLGAASLAGLYHRHGGARAPSLAAMAVALVGVSLYTLRFKPPSLGWAAAALILAALGAALVARTAGRLGAAARWLMVSLVLASSLLFPIHESVLIVRSNANDSLGLATLRASTIAALSAYLAPRTAGLRYELVADEPLALAPLIIRDQRPILPLTSFGGIRLVGVRELKSAVRAGAVRYGLVRRSRCRVPASRAAACVRAAAWIRSNGVDVSASAGLVGSVRLYLLRPQGLG